MSKEVLIKGAAYVYLENLVGMIAGYGFWFIMTKVTNPQTVGVSSAIISLATIFSVIGSIAVPTGIQRFVGKTYFKGNIEDLKTYAISSLLLVGVGTCCSAVVVMSWHNIFFGTKIDNDLIIVSVLLITSTAFMNLFRSIVLSSLHRAVFIPIIMIISTLAKILLAILLVIFHQGALGITVGFTFAPVIAAILFAVRLRGVLSPLTLQNKFGSKVTMIGSFKEILAASVSSWIPMIVYTLGSHLGTIVVFGANGAREAAIFFIALSFITAIMAIMSTLYSVATPILSSMVDGRKRFSWRMIKISLILSLPLSCTFLFYSNDILRIFGKEYESGATTLVILMLSVLPVVITTGISTLVYSFGNYRQVLLIGLASNLPRPALYFVLVPVLFNIGAAISYTSGSIIGFVLALMIIRKIHMNLVWKDITLIFAIPTLMALALRLIHTNALIGITATLAISYAFFVKLGILSNEDLHDLKQVLPGTLNNFGTPLHTVINIITKKLK